MTLPFPRIISSLLTLAYGLSLVVYRSPFAALSSCSFIGPKSTLNITKQRRATIVRMA